MGLAALVLAGAGAAGVALLGDRGDGARVSTASSPTASPRPTTPSPPTESTASPTPTGSATSGTAKPSGSASPRPRPSATRPSRAPRPTGKPPTLVIEVVGAGTWASVVRGDDRVLFEGTLARGERRAYDDPLLRVRIADARAVRVLVNGRERPRPRGELLEAFVIRRG